MEARLTRRDMLRLAAVTTAGAALAACGAAPTPTPTPKPVAVATATPPPAAKPTEAPKPAAAVPASDAKGAIEMWIWETEPRWKNVEAASGLNQQFPNVTFKWTALPQADLLQKALTALASGLPSALPSILRINAASYRPFINTKGLVETTDLIADQKANVLPSQWEESLIQGKMHQFHDDTGVMMFGYRWDLFEKAGLPSATDKVQDLIKTYDDLIEVGKTLDKTVGAKLFNMLPNGGVFNTLMIQDSTGYFDVQGNAIFDSDYHVSVATAAQKIWDSGLVLSLDQAPQQWQAYKDGKMACMFYPNWQDFTIIDSAPETKGKWRVIKLPAVMKGGKRASVANGCALVVPSGKADAEKKLAVDVAKYLKYNLKASLAHMKEFSGAFVSFVPGLEGMTNTLSPVLDNQYTYKIYLDAARTENTLPNYRSSTVFYSNAATAVNDAMFKVLQNKAPIKDSLKFAADSIRQLQKDKGLM